MRTHSANPSGLTSIYLPSKSDRYCEAFLLHGHHPPPISSNTQYNKVWIKTLDKSKQHVAPDERNIVDTDRREPPYNW